MNRKNFPHRRFKRQQEALARHNGYPVSEFMLHHGGAISTDVHRDGKQNPRVPSSDVLSNLQVGE